MRIIRYDSTDEKLVLAGMITSGSVLAQLAPVWKPKGLFASKWMNLIAKWCFSYYEDYKQPPGSHIIHLVGDWAQKRGQDQIEDLNAIERLLDEINEMYKFSDEGLNPAQVVDRASRVFNKIRAKRLMQEMQDALDDSNLELFHELRSGTSKIELGQDSFTSVFNDSAAIEEMFDSSDESIINFDKHPALRQFLGDTFCRDAFVAFLACEKRGKSMFMQEVCMQALRSRRRVMMFQVGDMTRAQVMRRIAARVSYRTFKAKSVLYPISIERQDKKVLVKREFRRWDDTLELADAKRIFKEWQIRQTRSEGDNFVLHCSPSGSMTVSKIRSLILQKQQVSGFLPDLVCIDYADLLNTSTTMKDNRDKVNSIWSDLRGLSQELHCLVLTATQANADSYNRSSLGMRNFSEDKRKNAHATAIIAINQTTQEKKDGLIRLGFVVLREDDFHIEEQCHVATCFGVCNPMVLSIM